jgi:hypothetical protein
MNANSNTPLSVKDRIKELNEQNNKTDEFKMDFKDFRRKSSISLRVSSKPKILIFKTLYRQNAK